MTIPCERTRAVIETYRFLRQLIRNDIRAPRSVRQTAVWLERHYPRPADIFMVAHGFTGVFSDPYEATFPIEVPDPVEPELRVELTERRYNELLDAIAHMPVADGFSFRQWLDQWLDMPHPVLHGATPRDVAGRPGGYDVVWHVLVGIVDSAFQ